MLHVIRVISTLFFVLAFLYACGGQSSGESTESSTVTPSTNNIVPPSNPVALSGKAFYEQASLGCVACHGPNGEGQAFQAINTVSADTCPSCTDVDTLAASLQATMPTATGSPSDCIGTTPGTCAYDIATYMMESWFASSTPSTPPPAPAVTITPTSGISTSEDGTTASFSVRLTTEPAEDVNIDISIDDVTEGSINPGNLITLTFNDTNWNVNQTVTVTGVDDGDIDGTVNYMAITNTVVTADTDYMGINPDDVTIMNTDNEVFIPAGITVNPINGLTTNENGGTATFTVALDTMPSADVTINLSSMDATEGSVSPTSLIFTNLDYNAKTVTVTGVDDGIQDGPQAYVIVTSPASSADTDYANLDASDVSVTNIDNEAGTPGVLVTPTMGLITTEAGGTASYTVVLQSQPNAPVNVAIASDNLLEGTVDKASIDFDNTNWDTAQTITVTGVDDAVFDLDQAFNITNTITSADPAYTGLAVINVSATNQDDEPNPFLLGKAAYEAVGNNCDVCHGASGEGTAIFYDFNIGPVNNMCGLVDCLNEAELAAYIETEMPPSPNQANCDATCASNIAKYMLNNFSVVP